jgi:hypothetical protein
MRLFLTLKVTQICHSILSKEKLTQQMLEKVLLV